MSRMKRVVLTVGVASLALLAGAWAWRGLHASPQAIPRVLRPGISAQAPSAPLPTPGAPRSETEEAFWGALTSSLETEVTEGRETLLRMTEHYLCLSPEEARTFRTATLSAVEDVDRAWGVREESWIAVSTSAASDPELLGRLEEEIQFRYESEKERALQRVAVHLGGSERREGLRERLEEWIDALR